MKPRIPFAAWSFFIGLLLFADLRCAEDRSRPTSTSPAASRQDSTVESQKQAPPTADRPPTGVSGQRNSREAEQAPASVSGGKDAADIVEDELKKLAAGKILFNPPSDMKVGVTERIEARIGKGVIPDFTAGLKGKGQVQIKSLKVSTFMQVRW